MTSHLIQCERMLCERGAQSFRADDIHVRMSQPDLFDYHGYIGNLFAMLSGIELSLQMLGNLKVCIDSALDLSAPSLTPSSPARILDSRAELLWTRIVEPEPIRTPRSGKAPLRIITPMSVLTLPSY